MSSDSDYNKKVSRGKHRKESPFQNFVDDILDKINLCSSCRNKSDSCEISNDVSGSDASGSDASGSDASGSDVLRCDCQYGGNCLVAVIILVVIGIIVIGIYYWLSKYTRSHNLNANEGLGKILAQVPGAGAGFWELTHLFLFGVLGFFFPTCDAVILSIGAVWELVEHYLSLNLAPVRRPNGKGGFEETQWWYGSAVDVVVDIVGFYIGKSLRLIMLPPNPQDCEEVDCKTCHKYGHKHHLCDGYTRPKFFEEKDDISLLFFR